MIKNSIFLEIFLKSLYISCTLLIFYCLLIDHNHFFENFSNQKMTHKISKMIDFFDYYLYSKYDDSFIKNIKKQNTREFLNQISWAISYSTNKHISNGQFELYKRLSKIDEIIEKKENFLIKKFILSIEELNAFFYKQPNRDSIDTYSDNDTIFALDPTTSQDSEKIYLQFLNNYCLRTMNDLPFNYNGIKTWEMFFYPIMYIDYMLSKEDATYLEKPDIFQLKDINIILNIKTMCYKTSKRAHVKTFECIMDNTSSSIRSSKPILGEKPFFTCVNHTSERICSSNNFPSEMNGKKIFENFDFVTILTKQEEEEEGQGKEQNEKIGGHSKNYLYPINTKGSPVIKCYTRQSLKPEPLIFVLGDRNKKISSMQFLMDWQTFDKQ